jgi:hypothetical protein
MRVAPIVGSVSTNVGTIVAATVVNIGELVVIGVLVPFDMKISIASGVLLRTSVLFFVAVALAGLFVMVSF